LTDLQLGVDRVEEFLPAGLQRVADLADDTAGDLSSDPLSEPFPVDRYDSGHSQHERTGEPSGYRLEMDLHQRRTISTVSRAGNAPERAWAFATSTSSRAYIFPVTKVPSSPRRVFSTFDI